MKLLLALAALCLTFTFTTKAHAQAASNNVSLNSYADFRQFNTTRTDTTVGNGAGCAPDRYGYASCSGLACNKTITRGHYTNGVACCDYVYICREDGTVDPQLAAQAEKASFDDSIASAFDDSRTDNYWGYVNATANRSPNAGRVQSIDARLDACLGYAAVDTTVTSYTSCINTCNSGTNGYCTEAALNNGVSETAGVCHDRCECKYGMGPSGFVCNNL